MATYVRASSIVLLVGFILIPVVAAAQPAATPGRDALPPRDSRLGIVVLQFNDGTSGHYTHAFQILEKYGLKGSFGENGSVWGLQEICKFLQANKLPVMVMADAVRAVQNPRKYFPVTAEQIPNPGFSCDLDRNGRPDGFTRCSYAPAEVIPPCGCRVCGVCQGDDDVALRARGWRDEADPDGPLRR